jgi:hypothetical protein
MTFVSASYASSHAVSTSRGRDISIFRKTQTRGVQHGRDQEHREHLGHHPGHLVEQRPVEPERDGHPACAAARQIDRQRALEARDGAPRQHRVEQLDREERRADRDEERE